MNSTKPLTCAASMTFFMQSLDTTMLYLALPSIALSLNQPTLNMEWVIVLYMLTLIVVTPLNSSLTERFGVRRLYAFAILLFALGSTGCALSHTLTTMSLFRLLQGVGGALMLPIVKVLVLKTSPSHHQFFRLNTITLIGLAGTLIGPIVSGCLVYYVSWRAIFLINLPMILLCLYLNYRFVPKQRLPIMAFNLKRFALLSSSLCLFMSGLIAFNQQQLPLPAIVFLMLSAILLFHLYLKHVIQTKAQTGFPMLFKLRTFSISLCSNAGIRVFLSSVPLIISLVLQQELHYTALEVTIVMLVTAAGSILARFFLHALLVWSGYRNVLLMSTFAIAVIICLFSRPLMLHSLYWITLMMFFYGMLSSILYASMNTLIFSELDEKTYSVGNTMLIVTQLVAITMSVSLSFAVLRLLASFTQLSSSECYQLLFSMLSIGLVACCFIFFHLRQHDGNQLLSHNS